MKILYFLTGNAHKLQEASEILTGFEIQGIHLELDEIQALDPRLVIQHKLGQAGRLDARRPLLCEDVSLTFEAYHLLPGPLVKWFIDAAPHKNAALLLQMMQGQKNRQAIALCQYGYLDVQQQMHFFQGEIRGSIAESLCGESGFGWDPIFIPEGHTQTFAEMPADVKHGISHRKRALEALSAFFAI